MRGRATAAKAAWPFSAETSRPKGGPSGGNGGRGGDVILQADHDLNNLVAQFFQSPADRAGRRARPGQRDGRACGQDLIVKVPCGTLVWRLDRLEPAAGTPAPDETPGRLPPSWSGRP